MWKCSDCKENCDNDTGSQTHGLCWFCWEELDSFEFSTRSMIDHIFGVK